MSELCVRLAGPDDLVDMAQLLETVNIATYTDIAPGITRQALQNHYEAPGWLDGRVQLNQQALEEGGKMYIALDSGKIVGFTVATGTCAVEGLSLLPKYQLGILGPALMYHALASSLEKPDDLNFTVVPNTPAARMYRKLGAECLGDWPEDEWPTLVGGQKLPMEKFRMTLAARQQTAERLRSILLKRGRGMLIGLTDD